ncbi:hypothetical protein [Schinkia azotoformans]|uniref:hypothetical protein n=1 Tax=Schinkia azotoformans TaxID=1454 RepID=UPI0002F40339|nr:hypothetical protein [Schinkia azotoformans]MEC1640223.1 hypothetical protein [Schinkia azotoformans]MEC1718131.1 hypothetical protein [Schinkia azotoformans]MEC1720368.1 hypothetical protein [Schinkia azotoformans]MEC1742107.1 hypothetical protein [Schinkia azotoformans]MEC1748041.1 hypothetical protein [Schinkia azotoformans]
MSRFYRFRLPPWCRHFLLVLEQIMLPLVIFQAIRTLFLPTTFDVILLSILILTLVAFYLEWI